MHMHKFEKIWLTFGIGALIVFLTTVGVSAFYLGNKPPSCLTTINVDKVDQTKPFDKPGLHKVEGKGWDYELVYVASAFSYNP
ncbi:cytochrome B5, partial [Neobacillus drentensis]